MRFLLQHLEVTFWPQKVYGKAFGATNHRVSYAATTGIKTTTHGSSGARCNTFSAKYCIWCPSPHTSHAVTGSIKTATHGSGDDGGSIRWDGTAAEGVHCRADGHELADQVEERGELHSVIKHPVQRVMREPTLISHTEHRVPTPTTKKHSDLVD